jgi:NADP-dependent 3-hydroxy acid dehydrogenase YdfG
MVGLNILVNNAGVAPRIERYPDAYRGKLIYMYWNTRSRALFPLHNRLANWMIEQKKTNI